MVADEKRGRGRPPKQGKAMLEPITIRFPAEMIRQIDVIRESRLDEPDKSTVIRELVAEALSARGIRAPQEGKIVDLRRRK